MVKVRCFGSNGMRHSWRLSSDGSIDLDHVRRPVASCDRPPSVCPRGRPPPAIARRNLPATIVRRKLGALIVTDQQAAPIWSRADIAVEVRVAAPARAHRAARDREPCSELGRHLPAPGTTPMLVTVHHCLCRRYSAGGGPDVPHASAREASGPDRDGSRPWPGWPRRGLGVARASRSVDALA